MGTRELNQVSRRRSSYPWVTGQREKTRDPRCKGVRILKMTRWSVKLSLWMRSSLPERDMSDRAGLFQEKHITFLLFLW